MSEVQPALRFTKVWLITGVSTGFGEQLLLAALKAGNYVVGTTRNLKRLESREDLSGYLENQLLLVQSDLSTEDTVEMIFSRALARFGRLDVVVNNAAYGTMGEIETIPESDARASMDVNFWVPVAICKAAIQVFREVNPTGSGGTILNIGSVGGYSAGAALAYYCASKFALEGFTQSLVQELHPSWGINVFLIQPGAFETEWRRSNLKVYPPNREYLDPNSPAFRTRYAVENTPWPGDTAKASRLLLQLGNAKPGERIPGLGILGAKGDDEIPLRIQLGTDALLMVRSQSQKTIEDTNKIEEVANSTNMDGFDAEPMIQVVKAQFGLA